MKLTAQQDAAIHRIGQDVCVIAGPGSGKTRVLAERFAWLVLEKGLSPRNILALTFTEKAANEIKARVSKTNHPEIDFAPISTFHSLCARILKEFSIAAGLDPSTELWDERVASAELHASAEDVLNDAARSETAQLRKLFTTWNTANLVPDLCGLYEKIRCLSESFPQPQPPPDLPAVLSEFIAVGEGLTQIQPTTPNTHLFRENFEQALNRFRDLGMQPSWNHVAALGEFPNRKALTKVFQQPSKEFYESFGAIQAVLVTSLVSAERNYLIEIVRRIADRFEDRKRAAARMDFHDLEHRSIALLRNNSRIREELQRRFEHILMDEMQDTNPVQWQLLSLLRSPGTFFAVGDVNQSIYGFRFAAPREFIEYRKSIESKGGEIDFLGDNFRSRGQILHFTETVSSGLAGIEPPGLAAGRRFQTQNLPVSLNPFEEQQDEFNWLATEIECLRETFVVEPKNGDRLRRLELNDIAILVRTASKAEAIASVLAERKIPFALGGGRKFFDTQEAADCISYLELLANPLNTIARAAVLRGPLVGLSDEQLLNNEIHPGFESRLQLQRARLDDVSPDQFLIEAIDASGYLLSLNPGGRANIDKFLRITRELWQQGPQNMRDFVDELERMRTAAQEKSAPVSGQGEAVQILTVHSSKGLEFPVVFLASAYFSSPTNRASLTFAAPDRIGVRWTNPIDGRTYPDLQAKAIDEQQKSEEEHELQRQLYVALTRAEQKLYVSWAGTQKRGWLKYLEPHLEMSYEEGESVPLPPLLQGQRQVEPVEVERMIAQPDTLSSANPTHLSKYAACPRKFFLDEMAGLSNWPSVEPNTSSAELGTAVHQILAEQEVEHDSDEARELAQVFLDSPMAQRLSRANWVEREFDFVFALDGLVLQGQIDLCFGDSSGEISIVDFKTDRYISGDHDIQMAIYREALSLLYPGQVIRSYLYYLRSNQLVEASSKLDRKLLKRFQSGDSFETTPGPHCQRCWHFAQACPVTS